jgi:hypothetical protein
MSALRPYIGITDFMNFAQVEAMEKVFAANQKEGSARQLHVGVVMSYKTLNHIETKWSKAFPPNESIVEIFQSLDSYNCLHYADYDHDDDFYMNLALAMNYGGNRLRAVQLDMVWPNPAEILHALQVAGMMPEIILQVGKNAMEACNNEPMGVVRMLRKYKGVIDRVLLDKSMGKGLGMDAQFLLPFARAIRSYHPEFAIGAAGGLGPDTMHLVEPLLVEFPDLSIDAQSKLRPSGNALDPVDWGMAGSYLVNALRLVKQ